MAYFKEELPRSYLFAIGIDLFVGLIRLDMNNITINILSTMGIGCTTVF